MLDANGVNLSESKKQRLAIARLLIRNPTIVLVDEVTPPELDTTSNQIVQDALKRAQVGRTCIVTYQGSIKNIF